MLEVARREVSHVRDAEDLRREPSLPLVDHEPARLESVVQPWVRTSRREPERRDRVRASLGGQDEAEPETLEPGAQEVGGRGVATDAIRNPLLEELRQRLVEGV